MAVASSILLAHGHDSLLAAGTGPREPDATPRIAYYSFRSGNAEIYLMDPDGSNQTRLTDHGAADLSPAISPDGSEIVFESSRYGNQEILVMNAAGGDLRRLTTTAGFEFCSAWSPDGSQIAYSLGLGNGCAIHVVGADGTNGHQLTAGPGCDAIPDWSADGSSILFHSNRGGHYEIYVMNADGTDQRPLTDSPGDKVGPKWSPDGSRIVYALTDFPSQRASIHIMNADGTADTALTDGSWNDEAPDWSGDGGRIVFNSNRNGVNEIYTVDVAGGDLQRLTWDQGDSRGPHWGAVVLPSTIREPVRNDAGPGLVLHVPSPARAGVPIRFTTDQQAMADLRVFDSQGRCVRTLLRRSVDAGAHASFWDGRDQDGRLVPGAVYHCRLVCGDTKRTAAVVYLR